MPVYFISSKQIDRKQVEIDRDLAHHLQDVLRVKIGETLLLVDEQPKRYQAKVIASRPGTLLLKIEREETAGRNRPVVRLGIGILKGEKMDWVLQKATELGVADIIPLQTKRVIAKPKAERLSHQHERWMKILTEAAQQSGRWEVPSLRPPSDFETFLAEVRPVFKFIFYEAAPAGALRRKMAGALTASGSVQGTLLIGPEGGWEKFEVERAVEKGYSILSLGERTLRAETAALAALAIVQHEIDGLTEERDGNR